MSKKKEMLDALHSMSEYKAVLESVTQEERDLIESAVSDFLGNFAEKLLEPLVKNAVSDDFRKKLTEELQQYAVGGKKE